MPLRSPQAGTSKMMEFTQGNLLEADVEAVVNTVNTVGVMGKGIALMFKERFPENFEAYRDACMAGKVVTGELFITRSPELEGPRWIVNFPTKEHWRSPTKMEWVERGLVKLREFIVAQGIHSIALPPLGCGNGGLLWSDVRPRIESALEDLEEVRILVFEPTPKYQNVAKKNGVEKLTPARALIAEIVRRYWILGIECTLLEIQKLAWFLEKSLEDLKLANPLDLRFKADRYGPYAKRLTHLLDSLDGSYLHCDKRLADAGPMDTIWFEESKRATVDLYLRSSEASAYLPALEATERLIDGFQSPLGLELLATVDWLVAREDTETNLKAIRSALDSWPGGVQAGKRKQRLFDDRMLEIALRRLA